jgi:putative transposase
VASSLPRGERVALVDRQDPVVSVRTQAALLGLARSGLYYRPVAPRAGEVAIKHRLDELYTAHPYYGSRRLAAQLRRDGLPVNRKAVQRHMREMGIAGIAPGPLTSTPTPEHRVYPYLLRGVTAGYPNHVWGVDITYIKTQGSWLYLVAVLDWYSRYIVSWELSPTLELPFVLAAAAHALTTATPTIWNSDQGSQFTSQEYLLLLTTAEVRISMDGRGRAMDNIFTERLWRTIKYEEVYLHSYESPRDARRSLAAYIQFYNTQRLHQALAYRPPAELYYAPVPLRQSPAPGPISAVTTGGTIHPHAGLWISG